ncbi:hypothetical protein [Luteolibacter marinus]|uniref:hypothetical protein n=1 Tax=Luteolibacter marinus TaxID=2776705 RepID=UPI0018665EDE|nr:hypothetical protein [Luteolibacter marinus]
MNNADRIRDLAMAALRSSPYLEQVPRPVGFMLSFDRQRALYSSSEMPASSSPSRTTEKPRTRTEALVAAPATREVAVGFHWREVLGSTEGRTNRKRR